MIRLIRNGRTRYTVLTLATEVKPRAELRWRQVLVADRYSLRRRLLRPPRPGLRAPSHLRALCLPAGLLQPPARPLVGQGAPGPPMGAPGGGRGARRVLRDRAGEGPQRARERGREADRRLRRLDVDPARV